MPEDYLVSECSPTLAGIKTGSLFSYRYSSPDDVKLSVRSFNKRLSKKGLLVVSVFVTGDRALIYVCRPSRLKKDLSQKLAREMLSALGYNCDSFSACIARLTERLTENKDFPHEIGLFLGYPPEDVKGFIEKKGANSKYSGCWKVYSDVQRAEKLFTQYHKCKSIYCKQFNRGKSLEFLTVTG